MNWDFEGVEQSLEDILTAREKRAEYQQHLLQRYGAVLISYKLNIPGPVKYGPLIRRIFDEGLSALNNKLSEHSVNTIYSKVLYNNTGPEYFAAVSESASLIKRLVSDIEEEHSLGRIFDFDVWDAEGRQLGRDELGLEPRKCLLCNNDAFICARARNHSVSGLVSKIKTMASEYFDRK